MRIADFIIDRLNKKYGIKYISLLTGNGALVLNDALVKCKDITPICVHHEQNAGDFALGFSKYTNGLSVVTPTTGCAATNLLTSVLSAYQDHVPILFISGNVPLKQTSRYHRLNHKINLLKLGNQEADILEIVKPITKYCASIERSDMAQFEIDKAIDIALTAPFGPVWIDLPSDIGSSSALVDMINYGRPLKFNPEKEIEDKIQNLIENINVSKRPLVLCGNGIRLSNTSRQLKSFIEKYQLPCVFTYGAIDVLDFNHPLYIGRIGVRGDRAGNFSVQNADLLLVLGACLNIPETGYVASKFAEKAKKIAVDIRPETHKKIDIAMDEIIDCELNSFFKYIL